MAHTIDTQLGPNAIAPPADHTADSEGDLVFHDIPPFPENVPIAPLLRLSMKKLLDKDPEELDRLWRASCDLGFFYLDLRGAIEESKRDSGADLPNETTKEGKINGDGLLKDAAKMFNVGPSVFETPLEEKTKYDYKANGSYWGYKGLGMGVVDSKGTKDHNEIWNVSKDDICGNIDRCPGPDVLQDENMRDLLRSFITHSHALIDFMYKLLNDMLHLPTGTLQNLHRLKGTSGDQARWINSPPWEMDEKQKAIGEHTDFGSMTILFNKLGGLQILPPDSEQWCYVKPLKGHCICNLGDAMVKFTAGILRSNMHRVVNPPGAQSTSTRLSVIYFSRPEDQVILKVLDGSDMVDEARKSQPESADEEQITSKEWVIRRAMGKRVGGDWAKTLGTEGNRTKD